MASKLIEKLTNAELKRLCAERGLSQGGNKADLVERLKGSGLTIVTDSNVGTTMGNSWTPLSGPKISQVQDLEDFAQTIMGDYRMTIIQPIVNNIDKIMRRAKRNHPTADTAAVLAAYLGDSLFQQAIKHTNDVLEEKNVVYQLDSMTLCQHLGAMLQLNLHAFPDLEKWANLILQTPSTRTFLEYNAISHALRVVKPNIINREDNVCYMDPIAAFESTKKVFTQLNNDISEIVVNPPFVCCDDDLTNSVSTREIPGRVDKRKGNGFSIITSTCVVTGMVKALTLDALGTMEPANFRLEMDLKPTQTVGFDRSFTKPALVRYLLSHNIRPLGILPEHVRKGHPAVLVESTFVRLADVSDATLKSDFSILSFPGVGIIQKAWLGNDGTVAVSVMNKTSKAKKAHGHHRFLTSSNLFAQINKVQYIAIPSHITRGTESTILVNAVKSNDPIAMELFGMIHNKLKIITMTQGTADWYLGRRIGLTATGAEIVVKPLLRLLDSHSFSLVRGAIYKTSLEETTLENAPVPEPMLPSDPSELIEVLDQRSDDEADPIVAQSNFDDVEWGNDDVEEELSGEEYEEQLASAPIPSTGGNATALPAPDCSGAIYETFARRGFVDSYQETPDMRRGKLTEPRALSFVAKYMPFVKGAKVYTMGLAQSKDVEYVLDSKDGMFLLDVKQIPGIQVIAASINELECQLIQNTEVLRPCGLEIRTSKNFEVARERAMKPDVVICGSTEYHAIPELMPHFKLQMLHQAAVGKLSWNMLAAWGTTNPSRIVIIYYPSTVIEQYLALLKENHIAKLFTWFHGAGEQASDIDIINRIPSFVTKRTAVLLATHVPLLRAFYRYAFFRDELNQAGPIHTFRPSVVALYDVMKGSTDVECRAVADAWRGMTAKYTASTKLAIRLFYSVLVLAVKLANIREYVRTSGNDVSKLPRNLYEFRSKVSGGISLNSRLNALGKHLFTNPLPFGSIRTMRSAPMTPINRLRLANTWNKVLAARPVEMRAMLIGRAERDKRPLDSLDFIGDTMIPASLSVRSKTTEGEYNVKPSYLERAQAYPAIFAKRPNPASRLSLRREYWMTVGTELRLNDKIWHCTLNIEGRPPACFWCGKRRQVASECLFCGEVLCSVSCDNAFHSDTQNMELTIDEEYDEESAKRMRPLDLPVASPIPITISEEVNVTEDL